METYKVTKLRWSNVHQVGFILEAFQEVTKALDIISQQLKQIYMAIPEDEYNPKI